MVSLPLYCAWHNNHPKTSPSPALASSSARVYRWWLWSPAQPCILSLPPPSDSPPACQSLAATDHTGHAAVAGPQLSWLGPPPYSPFSPSPPSLSSPLLS